MRGSTAADPVLNATALENVSIRPLPVRSAAAAILMMASASRTECVREIRLTVVEVCVTLATVTVGNCQIDGSIANVLTLPVADR